MKRAYRVQGETHTMAHRTVPTFAFAALAALVALSTSACAATHEEPPAPPPAPVDPAAFSAPARPPAPDVDLSADLDGGNLWADSATASGAGTAATDAGSDARPPASERRNKRL